MSVLIKGMEMPSTCSECRLAYDFMACGVTGNRWYDQDNIDASFDSNNARLPDCPLKEIPEKHGRLIDENEVRIVMNYLLTQPFKPTWNDTYNAIQEMNAVIEAEGADE